MRAYRISLHVALALLSLPITASAGHYRWGRTDATVAEPGAYALAFVLVPICIAIVALGLSKMTTTDHVDASPRPQHTPIRGVFAVARQLATALFNLF